MLSSSSNQLSIGSSVVVIDPTKLTPEQRKQLDELLAASKKFPITEKQILENRIKNLEDQIVKLSTRIYTLEISSNYKMFRDNNIPNEPWISPVQPYAIPYIGTTGDTIPPPVTSVMMGYIAGDGPDA